MKMKKETNNKQGVSLIVLVITIIVMIVLAGTIIISLNNSGIIGKAEDAVKQTNIATIREVAQMAWAEAYMDGSREQSELEKAVTDALAQNKITEKDYEGYTLVVTTKGVELVDAESEREKALNHSGIIPEGDVYYRGIVAHPEDATDGYNGLDYSNAVTYKAGEAFPETPRTGDRYTYGDYEYLYNTHYDTMSGAYFMDQSTIEGWMVKILDPNTKVLGHILQSVNGEPITRADCAFEYSNAESFVDGFELPKTVETVYMIFAGAGNIPDNFAIAEGVTSLEGMFAYRDLPENLSDLIIPNSVTKLGGMFEGASDCHEEDEYIVVENFTIPSNVKDISWLFNYLNLRGTITIDANPTDYEGCFEGVDMSNITLAGKCSRELKQLIANTGENADQVTIID